MDCIRDRAIRSIKSRLSKRNRMSLEHLDLVPASVLALVYRRNARYWLLLNKRSDYVKHHKGEIAFPGGRQDPSDRDHLSTALREANEEMGISPEQVTILGELDSVATNSNYLVRPYLGTIVYPYEFHCNPKEVQKVLEVPLEDLIAPGNLREEAMWIDGNVIKTQAYACGDHIVWGATARIIAQIVELFQNDSLAFEEIDVEK